MFHSGKPFFGGPIGLVRNSLTEPTRVTYARSDVVKYGSVLQFPVYNDKVLPIAQGADQAISGTVISQNFPTPYSLQWTFGIEKQFAKDYVFETTYVGNRGLKLTMDHEINRPDRLTGIRPFGSFLTYTFYDASESSNYQAWQSSLRKRFSHGFLASFNYTWSRNMSYTGDADLLQPDPPQDDNNTAADYGRTNFDVRHRVVADFVWELPLARWARAAQGRGMRLLMSGWQLAGIVNAQTGLPISIIQSSGISSSRPDYAGGDPFLANARGTLGYLNAKAFSLVPVNKTSGLPVRPGTVGRNVLNGPGLWNVDASLSKRLDFTERLHLQIRADMLNAFNHTNYSNPVSDLTNRDFGRLTSTLGARQVQFSARLTF